MTNFVEDMVSLLLGRHESQEREPAQRQTQQQAPDPFERLYAAARRNQRPIQYYQTRLGPARLETDPTDPTQAWYVGDVFEISIAHFNEARRHRTLRAARVFSQATLVELNLWAG